MTDSREMADFVYRRLHAILKCPDGWGPPHAVELQVLLLIEMMHTLCGCPVDEVDGVTGRFSRFLAEVVPGPPAPLAIRLGLAQRSTDAFVQILRGFVVSELRRRAGNTRVETAQAPALPCQDSASAPHLAAA